MKKVLSVLCMALLAGGMIFTSCTKNFTITVNSNNDAWGTVTGGGTFADQATTVLTATPNAGYKFVKWQDGVTENPRTITVTANETYTAFFEALPQNEAKITFNGTSWVAANALAIDYTDEDYLAIYFFKVASSQEDIYCNGFLESVPVSGATYESTGGDIMQYRDPNHTYTDNDGNLGDPGTTYWGYNTLTNSFLENITAVDLNALTLSGNWTAQVGEVSEYATTGEWSTTYAFSGNLTNAEWAWASKGLDAKRTKTSTLAVK